MQKLVLDEACKSLNSCFGKTVSIIDIKQLGGGSINNALKINTNVGLFFLKWNALGVEDMFLREAESLIELNKATNNVIQVPKVYAAEEVNETPGFLLTEFYTSSYEDYSEELGEGLAMIHQYGCEGFGFGTNNYCGATEQNNNWKKDWLTFYRENRLEFLIGLISEKWGLSKEHRILFEKLMNRLDQLIPADEKNSLIHGDLWSGNYMWSTNGPVLIDPAASYSNREMEFGIITMFGGFSSDFFEAYNNVYPLAHDWRERNSLYQLYHILNHYYLFGGGYLNQAIRVANSYL